MANRKDGPARGQLPLAGKTEPPSTGALRTPGGFAPPRSTKRPRYRTRHPRLRLPEPGQTQPRSAAVEIPARTRRRGGSAAEVRSPRFARSGSGTWRQLCAERSSANAHAAPALNRAHELAPCWGRMARRVRMPQCHHLFVDSFPNLGLMSDDELRDFLACGRGTGPCDEAVERLLQRPHPAREDRRRPCRAGEEEAPARRPRHSGGRMPAIGSKKRAAAPVRAPSRPAPPRSRS